jgi:hypothetical protein
MNSTLNTDVIGNILNRLEDVKPLGTDKWTALCPSHADTNPSLAVARGDDGRVLLKCWAGCAASEIVDGIGITLADLFERPQQHYRSGRNRIRPDYKALLELLSFESMVVLICCQPALRGEQLDAVKQKSLARAVGNIQRIRNTAQ